MPKIKIRSFAEKIFCYLAKLQSPMYDPRVRLQDRLKAGMKFYSITTGGLITAVVACEYASQEKQRMESMLNNMNIGREPANNAEKKLD